MNILYFLLGVAVTIFIDIIAIHFAYLKGCKDKTEEYKSKFRELAFNLGLDSDGDVFGAINAANKRGYMVWIYVNAETGTFRRSVTDDISPNDNFNSIFNKGDESK